MGIAVFHEIIVRIGDKRFNYYCSPLSAAHRKFCDDFAIWKIFCKKGAQVISGPNWQIVLN